MQSFDEATTVRHVGAGEYAGDVPDGWQQGRGAWGGLACGIFGSKALGGLGGVSLSSQAAGTALGIGIALAGGFALYGALKAAVGIRLDPEAEFEGADLSIHKITATPEREERA